MSQKPENSPKKIAIVRLGQVVDFLSKKSEVLGEGSLEIYFFSKRKSRNDVFKVISDFLMAKTNETQWAHTFLKFLLWANRQNSWKPNWPGVVFTMISISRVVQKDKTNEHTPFSNFLMGRKTKLMKIELAGSCFHNDLKFSDGPKGQNKMSTHLSQSL